MRTRLMTWVLPMACLGGCVQTAPAGTAMAEAAPAPKRAAPAPSAADAALAIAIARDAADRAAREQVMRVQKQLREQERAREAAVHAQASGNERCIDGQKMRRVPNGWVQAGEC